MIVFIAYIEHQCNELLLFKAFNFLPIISLRFKGLRIRTELVVKIFFCNYKLSYELDFNNFRCESDSYEPVKATNI